jgi:protein-tyrosine phosphatase
MPGMDDGPAKIEESLSMVEIAISEGITSIVATPHFTASGHLDVFLSERDNKLNEITQILTEKGFKIDILKGAELYIDMKFLTFRNLQKLTINGTRYILTELPLMGFPLYTEEFFYRLQFAGFLPIIAHPERNAEVIRNPELLYRLVEAGSLVQINTGSITGVFGASAQKCARSIINRDMAHIVATDAHSDRRRKPEFRFCIKLLNLWFGKAKTEKLVMKNPGDIVKDKDIARYRKFQAMTN